MAGGVVDSPRQTGRVRSRPSVSAYPEDQQGLLLLDQSSSTTLAIDKRLVFCGVLPWFLLAVWIGRSGLSYCPLGVSEGDPNSRVSEGNPALLRQAQCIAVYRPLGVVPNKREWLYRQLNRPLSLGFFDPHDREHHRVEACLRWGLPKCNSTSSSSHFSIEYLIPEGLREHPSVVEDGRMFTMPKGQELLGLDYGAGAGVSSTHKSTAQTSTQPSGPFVPPDLDLMFVHSFVEKEGPNHGNSFENLIPALFKRTGGTNFAQVNMWVSTSDIGINLGHVLHQDRNGIYPRGARSGLVRGGRGVFGEFARDIVVPFGHLERWLSFPTDGRGLGEDEGVSLGEGLVEEAHGRAQLAPDREREFLFFFYGGRGRGREHNHANRAVVMETAERAVETDARKRKNFIRFTDTKNTTSSNASPASSASAAPEDVSSAHDLFGKDTIQTSLLRRVFDGTFCLCPAGDDDSSRRIFTAILAGCLPVVLSPWVVLPFESLMEWSEFAIFPEDILDSDVESRDSYSADELKELFGALVRMPDKEIRRRRVALNCVRDHFVYGRPAFGNSTGKNPGGTSGHVRSGDAVDTIALELANRALVQRGLRRWVRRHR